MNAPLRDQFGRVATDLRVSLTDRCNLRCGYCMPESGLDWIPPDQQLTDDELIRLMRIAVEQLGIDEIRLTGGEPLLRKNLIPLVVSIKALRPAPALSMTTNGIGLHRHADALAAAGLDRVNVSLDTLDRERYRTITRRDRLPVVLAGLAAAHSAGLRPVKVNAVLLRDVNTCDAVALLRFCVSHGYRLRFIEHMPLDAHGGWSRADMVTADDVAALLSSAFELTPAPGQRGSAPAEEFLVDGGPATVGIIGSVTRSFCAACNRTRLTSDGQVRNCLFSHEETNLRDLMRSGAGDADIAAAWREAMWGKLFGHAVNDAGFVQPLRPMSAIGG